MARNDESAKLVVDEKMAEAIRQLKTDLADVNKSAEQIMKNLRNAFDQKFIKESTDVWLGVQERILSQTERQYAEIQELSKAYNKVVDQLRSEKALNETINAQAKAKHSFQAQQLAHLKRIGALEDKEVEMLGKIGKSEEEKAEILKEQEKIHQKIADLSDKMIERDEEALKLLRDKGIELHNQETSKARTLKLEEKVSHVADHIGRSFFGINGHVDTMGTGMAYFVAKMIQGDENASRIFPSIAERLKKLYLTLPNMMIATQQKGEELLTNSLRLNMDYYNNQQRIFQETGMQRSEYQDTMNDTVKSLNRLSITSDEALNSIRTLYSEMNDFSETNEAQKKELIETTAVLKRLGVQESTSAKALNELNKTMGMSINDSRQLTEEITKFAVVLGKDTNKVVSDLSNNMDHLSRYSGKEMIKVFKELEIVSKKTGLEINSLVNFTKGFDTFESAAEKVGGLNTFLKGPFLNTLDFINETDPAKRIKMISDALKASGQNFSEMGYYAKEAFSERLGMSVEQLSKLLGNQTNSIESITKALNEESVALGDVKNIAEKNSTTEQRTKSIMEQAASITELNDTLTKGIDILTGWRGSLIIAMQALQGLSAVSTILGAGGILGSLTKLVSVTNTWAGSLSGVGKILGKLGLVGAGYGLSTLGNDDPGSGVDIFGDIAGGALAGAAFGPWGAAIGGLVGGITNISSVSNMFADGTDSSPSGLAIVGEKGPEIVSLPGNSSVINNSNTNRIIESFSSSSKTSVNTNTQNKTQTLNVIVKLDSDVLTKFTKNVTAEYLEETMNIVVK